MRKITRNPGNPGKASLKGSIEVLLASSPRKLVKYHDLTRNTSGEPVSSGFIPISTAVNSLDSVHQHK